MPISIRPWFREDVVPVACPREERATLDQVAKHFEAHELALDKWIRQAGIDDDGNRPGRAREGSVELREPCFRCRPLSGRSFSNAVSSLVGGD